MPVENEQVAMILLTKGHYQRLADLLQKHNYHELSSLTMLAKGLSDGDRWQDTLTYCWWKTGGRRNNGRIWKGDR